MNKYDTKVLIQTTRRNLEKSINVGEYSIEVVHRFVSMGTGLTNPNKDPDKIHVQIQAGNRTYFPTFLLLKKCNTSQKVQVMLHTTHTNSAALYGSETWTLYQKDVNMTNSLEEKIFRKIFRPMQAGEVENQTQKEDM